VWAKYRVSERDGRWYIHCSLWFRGLTTWSILILEKLIVTQPDKKVLSFYKASTEVKKEWSYTSAPPTFLHGMDRDTLTFL
jgi:hypothetical protein